MAGKLQVRWRLGVRCGVRAGARAAVGWLVGCLDGRCVSSVSETGPDTPVYPVYLTVTKLLLMRCVSSVSEARADTQCIWCIWGPQPVYLPSRVAARAREREKVNADTHAPRGEQADGGEPQTILGRLRRVVLPVKRDCSADNPNTPGDYSSCAPEE